jgi:hypothetical protein
VILVVPGANNVTTNPFALAIVGLSNETLNAPGEFVVGGVSVTVP